MENTINTDNSNLLYNKPFFFGVIEDREDPQKMGRVRVRVFGVHSEDKNNIPTEDLPWAIPCLGTYGYNYKPPQEGMIAFGVFLDGRDCQHPLLLGIIPSMPTSFPDPQKGFAGKSGTSPDPFSIWQPDISRLARGEDLVDSIVQEKIVTKDAEIEPKLFYNTKYPYNFAWETESGHAIELDDTPGSERINIHHTSGTFDEYGPNGDKIKKITGSNYTIVEKNDSIVIYGNANVHIKGSNNIRIDGDCNLQVDGSVRHNIHGDYIINVGGGIYINSRDTFNLKSSSIKQESWLADINFYSRSDFNVETKNNMNLHANTGVLAQYAKDHIIIESDSSFYLDVQNDTNIKSSGNLGMEGNRIDLNTDGVVQPDPNKSSLNRPTGAISVQRPLVGVNPIERKFIYIAADGWQDQYSSIEDSPIIKNHIEE